MNKSKLLTLSWGCGVQSTTLAAMSALGYLPKLDLVITSDTQWEQAKTYEIREWYTHWLIDHGISVEVVTNGSVKVNGCQEHIHVPFWTANGGPLQRQCTSNFKIVPIKRRLREHLGLHPSKPPNPEPNSVEQWIGFSLDEWTRMKHSRVQYIKNAWPLIDKRMTRNDCIAFLEDNRLPIPVKSACIGCPYRAASEWLEMATTADTEFSEAVSFDTENRHNPLADNGSTASELYIYSHVEPLENSDLERDAHRERKAKQLPLMICEEGFCWV